MDVNHDEIAHRFTCNVDGHACELDYRLADGVMTITHTGVPAEVSGRGIASDLAKAAMAHARAKGWKVTPACSYAVEFMKRHPEFEDLRA
ncbi:GNAT family N-acetyltransferase [soil metagenome]